MRVLAVVLGAGVMVQAASYGSTSSAPTPGTAAQVRSLVAHATSINQLSKAMDSELPASPYDFPYRLYPSTGTFTTNLCVTMTACVLGDTTSKKTIILLGDSHADMWLPAIAPAAVTLHYRLIVVWQSSCPIANLKNYLYQFSTTNTGCQAWRTKILSEIPSIDPALVILGERTANVVSEPSGKRFTKAQWQSALESTIRTIQSPTTKVAVLEDIPFLDSNPPEACITRYPTHIQAECSVRNPNPKYPGQQVAEQSAATATGAAFIETVPWICSDRCSPVIGTFFSYSDQGHVSATYAQYLSGVMTTALRKVLP